MVSSVIVGTLEWKSDNECMENFAAHSFPIQNVSCQKMTDINKNNFIVSNRRRGSVKEKS